MITCPWCQVEQPIGNFQTMRVPFWLSVAGFLYRCTNCRMFIALKVPIQELVVEKKVDKYEVVRVVSEAQTE